MATLAHELHDLVLQMDRSAEERLRPFGLGYRRYVALVVIGEHPGLAGRDLAGALQVTEAAVSKMVSALVADGLVVAHQQAGRRRALVLTDAGRRVLEAATAALGDSFDRCVRECGIDPVELARDIRRIRDAL